MTWWLQWATPTRAIKVSFIFSFDFVSYPLFSTLHLSIRAKIGSSERVKSLQNQTFFGNCGATRRFFFGRAERKPNVFLEGMRFWVAGSDRVFVFARQGRYIFGKIEVRTI